MFFNIELVLLLTLGNLCSLEGFSFLSFWRDRDIKKAPHLCPKRWEYLGAVRAGGPLQTLIQPNKTIVLQCRFCEDPEENEDDDDIGMWTYVDIVRGTAPVRVPRPNVDDRNSTAGSFLGTGRKPRIVQAEGRSLALRKPRTTDLGLYQCRRDGVTSSIGSTVRYLIDMDIASFEGQLIREKENNVHEDNEEDEENDGYENSTTESTSTVKDEDNDWINANPSINGTSDDWPTYRKDHLISLEKVVAHSNLHLEAISEWSPWTDCRHCWTTKYGVRTRRGVCVLRLPLRESADDDALVKELVGLPSLACRSALLSRLHPQVADAAQKVPDFVEFDYKGCNGVCLKNTSKSHGSLLYRLVHLFRHRRDTPLITRNKMTIYAGEALVIVCPELFGKLRYINQGYVKSATTYTRVPGDFLRFRRNQPIASTKSSNCRHPLDTWETPVHWEKDGDAIGGGNWKSSPHNNRNPVERIMTKMRQMEHWVSGEIVGIKATPENTPSVDSAGVLKVPSAAPRNSGNYQCSVNGVPRGSFQVEVIVKSALTLDDVMRHFAYVSLVLLSCIMVWCGVVICVSLRKRHRTKKYSVLPQSAQPPSATSEKDSSRSQSDTLKSDTPSQQSTFDNAGGAGKRKGKNKSAIHLPSRKLLRSANADSPGPPSPPTASYHKVTSRLRDQFRIRPLSRPSSNDIELVRLLLPKPPPRSTNCHSGRRQYSPSNCSSEIVELDGVGTGTTTADKSPLISLSQQPFPSPLQELPTAPLYSWSPSAISSSVLRARNSSKQVNAASFFPNTSKMLKNEQSSQIHQQSTKTSREPNIRSRKKISKRCRSKSAVSGKPRHHSQASKTSHGKSRKPLKKRLPFSSSPASSHTKSPVQITSQPKSSSRRLSSIRSFASRLTASPIIVSKKNSPVHPGSTRSPCLSLLYKALPSPKLTASSSNSRDRVSSMSFLSNSVEDKDPVKASTDTVEAPTFNDTIKSYEGTTSKRLSVATLWPKVLPARTKPLVPFVQQSIFEIEQPLEKSQTRFLNLPTPIRLPQQQRVTPISNSLEKLKETFLEKSQTFKSTSQRSFLVPPPVAIASHCQSEITPPLSIRSGAKDRSTSSFSNEPPKSMTSNSRQQKTAKIRTPRSAQSKSRPKSVNQSAKEVSRQVLPDTVPVPAMNKDASSKQSTGTSTSQSIFIPITDHQEVSAAEDELVSFPTAQKQRILSLEKNTSPVVKEQSITQRSQSPSEKAETILSLEPSSRYTGSKSDVFTGFRETRSEDITPPITRFRTSRTEIENRASTSSDWVSAHHKATKKPFFSTKSLQIHEATPAVTTLRKLASTRYSKHKGFYVRQTPGLDKFQIILVDTKQNETAAPKQSPMTASRDKPTASRSKENSKSHSSVFESVTKSATPAAAIAIPQIISASLLWPVNPPPEVIKMKSEYKPIPTEPQAVSEAETMRPSTRTPPIRSAVSKTASKGTRSINKARNRSKKLSHVNMPTVIGPLEFMSTMSDSTMPPSSTHSTISYRPLTTNHGFSLSYQYMKLTQSLPQACGSPSLINLINTKSLREFQAKSTMTSPRLKQRLGTVPAAYRQSSIQPDSRYATQLSLREPSPVSSHTTQVEDGDTSAQVLHQSGQDTPRPHRSLKDESTSFGSLCESFAKPRRARLATTEIALQVSDVRFRSQNAPTQTYFSTFKKSKRQQFASTRRGPVSAKVTAPPYILQRSDLVRSNVTKALPDDYATHLSPPTQNYPQSLPQVPPQSRLPIPVRKKSPQRAKLGQSQPKAPLFPSSNPTRRPQSGRTAEAPSKSTRRKPPIPHRSSTKKRQGGPALNTRSPKPPPSQTLKSGILRNTLIRMTDNTTQVTDPDTPFAFQDYDSHHIISQSSPATDAKMGKKNSLESTFHTVKVEAELESPQRMSHAGLDHSSSPHLCTGTLLYLTNPPFKLTADNLKPAFSGALANAAQGVIAISMAPTNQEDLSQSNGRVSELFPQNTTMHETSPNPQIRKSKSRISLRCQTRSRSQVTLKKKFRQQETANKQLSKTLTSFPKTSQLQPSGAKNSSSKSESLIVGPDVFVFGTPQDQQVSASGHNISTGTPCQPQSSAPTFLTDITNFTEGTPEVHSSSFLQDGFVSVRAISTVHFEGGKTQNGKRQDLK